MPVTSFPLGAWETNSHLLYRDGGAVIVDVGDAPDAILAFLRREALTLSHILVTHLHCDHVYGVAALRAATGAPVLIPAGEAYLRGTPDAEGGNGWPEVAPFPFAALPPGRQNFGGFAFEVLETPGHTRGSVSLHCPAENAVFTGDALFYRAIGSTEYLGGDIASLLRSIRERLFALPDDTVAYPGHGPVTRIGDEKRDNPFCGTNAGR